MIDLPRLRPLFPTCPHCGHRHVDSVLRFKTKEVEYVCERCHQTFWSTHQGMNYFYTSKMKAELPDVKHK